MINNYHDESVDVADNFIQTICFIDDQPFFTNVEDPVNDDVDHRINADIVTKAFAVKGKTCSFLKYNKLEDEDIVLDMAKSSDVTVLDWRILMDDDDKEIPLKKDNAEEDLESDVEEKESRGKYAIRLLDKILREDHNAPKLILIFTAEYVSDDIYLPIKEKLEELKIQFEEDEENLTFHNDKIRISIYFKLSQPDKSLPEQVINKKVDFRNLPDTINIEFAKLTDALVLQTAIRAISEVRNKTFCLLESYNKKLDPAYLAHRSLLPSPSDAEEQLIEIIGSDIKSLIRESNIKNNIQDKALKFYLDEKYDEGEYPFIIEKRGEMPDLELPTLLDKETVHSIVLNGVESTFVKKNKPFNQSLLFSKECHKNLTQTFAVNKEEADESDVRFSKLTTIKSRYQSEKFFLSLGTILKEPKNENYWLCIQPKCDSVRIKKKKRNFLLLKLNSVECDKRFDFVLNVNETIKYFRINYKIYEAKLTEFFVDGKGNVSTQDDISNGYIFKKGDNQNLQWIGELKNDFAQSVSNRFSHELSRVGLDISEWLRRSGN